jgi:hypothetical protein
MSQATAKATRRAIRKAVGPEAIDVINSHANSITDILHALETFNARLTERRDEHDALAEFARGVAADGLAFRSLGVLGRLKWLVLGR